MMIQRILPFLSLIILLSCQIEKQPIKFGTDACEFCKMIAMDPRFGAEIITEKGKVFKFDDVNCMITFMNGPGLNGVKVAGHYVIDFGTPGELIDAKSALFVQSDAIRSPMASGIAAFSNADARYEQQQQWQARELTWEEVMLTFK